MSPENLEKLIDRIETYKIMCEVFYQNIPKDKKVEALAEAAERISYEFRDSENESKNV